MQINTNISSIEANRQLGLRVQEISKSAEKLASGVRINRASDDASGLSVSERMRSQIRGLNQASRNIQDGVSLTQTTEGYLQGTQDVLQRLRELAVQSSNGIYTQSDRAQIQVEVSSLVDEVSRVASHAQFNGMNLLTGGFSNGLNFQVGANANQTVSVKIEAATAEALGLRDAQGGLDLSSAESANSSLLKLDSALDKVSKQRANLGAYQNRFEFMVKGVDIASENLTASESRIRDTNVASEMVSFAKNQILQQSSIAMLAQSNNNSNGVLKLLG